MYKLLIDFVGLRDVANNTSIAIPEQPLNPFKDNKPMKRAPTEPKGDNIKSPIGSYICVPIMGINHPMTDTYNICNVKPCKRNSSDERHLMLLTSDNSRE